MTVLGALNVDYATIGEMAVSHSRTTLGLARRAAARLFAAGKKRPYLRWQLGGGLFVGIIVATLFTNIPIAHATGEQYSWAAKGVLHVQGGNVGPANPVIEYQVIQVTGDPTTATLIMAPSTCTATVQVSASADHKTVTIKATAVSTPCVMSYANQLNGTFNVANTDVWGQPDIPIGCPGGPAGPTTGSFPCPGGGQVVNGTYYPDDNTGRIQGKVTLTPNCTDANCGCPNATVNVTRLNGTYTGDTSVKTGGDGTYVLMLGAGDVQLSTPDCHKSDGSIYSGQSATITVVALKSSGPHDYVANTLVSSGGSTDEVCDNANFTELNYWVCGAIKLLKDTAEGLDNAVLGMLKLDTDTLFNDSGTARTGNSYFIAWSAFRNIAYAILVIFALIMIASQILGLDMIDAYTLRKMLPRLIIATILIAISWDAMDFLFNLSNDATDAVRSIIAAPFHGLNVTIGATPTNDITLAVLIPTFLTVGTAAGIASLALLGVGGIAALIGTIVLAVFSAWVLLVARNVVADLLVIMSPIAMVLWAFGR